MHRGMPGQRTPQIAIQTLDPFIFHFLLFPALCFARNPIILCFLLSFLFFPFLSFFYLWFYGYLRRVEYFDRSKRAKVSRFVRAEDQVDFA